jgi:hypothetical protein
MEWREALTLSALGTAVVVALGYLALIFHHWP